MMKEGYFRGQTPRRSDAVLRPVLLLVLMYDSKPEKQEEALRLLHAHIEELAGNYHISHGEHKMNLNEYMNGGISPCC